MVGFVVVRCLSRIKKCAGPARGPARVGPACHRAARVVESRTIHHVQSLLLKHPKGKHWTSSTDVYLFVLPPSPPDQLISRSMTRRPWKRDDWVPSRGSVIRDPRGHGPQLTLPGRAASSPGPSRPLVPPGCQPSSLVLVLWVLNVPDWDPPTTWGSNNYPTQPELSNSILNISSCQ